jgi:hypothetical protein
MMKNPDHIVYQSDRRRYTLCQFLPGCVAGGGTIDLLKKLDYLSTVSGGHIVGALSRLWCGLWKDRFSSSPDFAVDAQDFSL